MTKILIADDHDLVRDTLCAFLEREHACDVKLAQDFDATAQMIESEGPFDLVLLDYNMPGMNGLEGLKRACALNNGGAVALMSGIADRSVAQSALACGAAGFLPKTMSAKSLIHAVNFIAAGEQYAPVAFMTAATDKAVEQRSGDFSERELEVLNGLCRGLSNKEIGRELNLQEVTIKLHVRTLNRKLKARNRTHAAMIAREKGLF